MISILAIVLSSGIETDAPAAPIGHPLGSTQQLRLAVFAMFYGINGLTIGLPNLS